MLVLHLAVLRQRESILDIRGGKDVPWQTECQRTNSADVRE